MCLAASSQQSQIYCLKIRIFFLPLLLILNEELCKDSQPPSLEQLVCRSYSLRGRMDPRGLHADALLILVPEGRSQS